MSILGRTEKYLLEQALYWIKQSKKPENLSDYSSGLARGFVCSFATVMNYDNLSMRLSELEQKISSPERRVLP